MTYPCVINCSDPYGGKVKITHVGYVFPHESAANKQYVDIKNYGTRTVSLADQQLRTWPYNYVFPTWFTLAPGASVRVHIIDGAHPANSHSDLYWNPGTVYPLNNTSDEVDLSTLSDIRISCTTWNNTSGASATCNW